MNGFEKAVETVGKDALDVIESPVKLIEFCTKAEKVLATAIKDQPELQSVLTAMVTKAESVGQEVAPIVASDGTNIVADVTEASDVEAFFQYVLSTVVPAIEAVYAEVKTDVTVVAS